MEIAANQTVHSGADIAVRMMIEEVLKETMTHNGESVFSMRIQHFPGAEEHLMEGASVSQREFDGAGVEGMPIEEGCMLKR
jgi:hypothetical protein